MLFIIVPSAEEPVLKVLDHHSIKLDPFVFEVLDEHCWGYSFVLEYFFSKLFIIPLIKCFLEIFAKSVAKTFNYRIVCLRGVVEFLLCSCPFASNIPSNNSRVLSWGGGNWKGVSKCC